jgi:uncharacterized protein YbjQ (UPF0145 family)
MLPNLGQTMLVGLAFIAAVPSAAQNMTPLPNEAAAVVLARKVPVTAGDILDRPYRVLGRIDVGVTRALWQKVPDQRKVYRELWERAKKVGADAVVFAEYGTPERSFTSSWGGRRANGKAIKFLSADEIEALKR